MGCKERLTEETIAAAKQLLEMDVEMLHSYPEAHCKYCGKRRRHARFDEECPALLRAALRVAQGRERARCARVCVNEYARWKNAEPDTYGIAIGAIGAASNILCAIEGIEAEADPPIHPNEVGGES